MGFCEIRAIGRLYTREGSIKFKKLSIMVGLGLGLAHLLLAGNHMGCQRYALRIALQFYSGLHKTL